MLKPCENMKGDIESLADWANIFLHPTLLEKTVKYNAENHKIALAKNVAQAKVSYSSGHSFKFGENVADILALVT